MSVDTNLTGHLPAAPAPRSRDTRQAELRLHGLRSEILINGTDVANAVHSLVLRGQAESLPELELDLLMPLVEVHGEVRVEIPDTTRDALIELGWTPPGGDA